MEKGPATPRDVVLEVKNLSVKATKEGHTKNLVSNVTFQVRKGEIVCVAGIDGNGQTELIHAITGLAEMSEGTVSYTHLDVYKRQSFFCLYFDCSFHNGSCLHLGNLRISNCQTAASVAHHWVEFM